MLAEIYTFRLSMPYGLGGVNSYLLKADDGWVLIDSGSPFSRSGLEQELESAGCKPGDLRLVVITHGDFDHTGCAAHLRRKYGTKIAMHRGDSGMAEQGDMLWNRGKSNIILKTLAPLLFGFGKDQRFQADIYLEDGDSLEKYGLDATIVTLPGHSLGSIGLLTHDGVLFCGDLLMNDKDKPSLGFGDPSSFKASLEKVSSMGVRRIYPGHGEPFSSACIDGVLIGEGSGNVNKESVRR